MAADNLPLYRINDFEVPQEPAPYFYINRFSEHIRRHAFVQKPHKHDFYILLLITQGTGFHYIDFKPYLVQPHTVFCLRPGQVHNWQLSEDTEGYILFFAPEYYLLRYPQVKLYNFPFFNPLLHSPCLHTTAAAESDLLHITHKIEEEHTQHKLRKEEAIGAYLHLLFVFLTRLYQEQQPDGQLSLYEISVLQRLENLIEQHYTAHKPVSFYAAKLHLTPKTLNEACRHIGKKTTELIQDRIILEAKRLLVHSPLTVTQIAAELGYFDNSYFTRFFRKHTGFAPEQFRREQLKS